MSSSYLERITEMLIKEAKLPIPEKEFRFHPERRWRFDFCYVAQKIAIEIEGGLYMPKSAHNTGAGISRDIEKGNEAMLLGYKVIRVTKLHLVNGQAMEWLKRALNLS